MATSLFWDSVDFADIRVRTKLPTPTNDSSQDAHSRNGPRFSRQKLSCKRFHSPLRDRDVTLTSTGFSGTALSTVSLPCLGTWRTAATENANLIVDRRWST